MNTAGPCLALALTLLLGPGLAPARSQPGPSTIERAGQLFQAGNFAEARSLYGSVVAKDPHNHAALVALARLALMANRLEEARTWLEQAIALQPEDAEARVMLAALFYRRDDFDRAAAALRGIDGSRNPLVASHFPTLNLAMLESFQGQAPYAVEGRAPATRLPFLKTDPLPVVRVRVNGGEPVTFFIDT